ncbi:DUF3422 domain-containing protein [Shewanella sp. D64]|uniref:DUF3422 family protein n=1 Tax=unclassified Shewanella TaxID=196818 RepID=UPI0022BA2871|nr:MULTISPECIES: DUF3422 domain-containing protein [unclassified Shewanella]MEC4724159.1 DUF3422 domain-containing protein [Shewanella sp. D64]MEC4736179.1 DUF3422 domain-containing protein [Shewanella sp. E94]WBJ97885.1 DUF3422 domain-containing protein [Shewanella sp. MTB7]
MEQVKEKSDTKFDKLMLGESPVLIGQRSISVSPLRQQLSLELHSRPAPKVSNPTSVSHVAIRVNLEDRQREYQHLSSFCHRYSVNPPCMEASCFFQDFGGFELRWEKHLEFSTYSFIRKGQGKQLFDGYSIERVPQHWFDDLVGELVCAINLVFTQETLSEHDIYQGFEGQQVIGSRVAAGRALVYSSFRLHSDGFSRTLIHSEQLNRHQAGRLIQRILEIETYQMLALLSLPIARELSPKVSEMEQELVQLNQQMVNLSQHDDSDMLDRLSHLAGQTEQLIADISYRFSATNAYYALVCTRLDQLNEQDIVGLERINEFVTRRLTPGIRTCQALNQRLEDLTRRIARASSLLRTRVDLSIEQQNQQLLHAINQRGKIQLRLQQMVEGVSVAAMAYYLVGLLEYILNAFNANGYTLNKMILEGLAVPFFLFFAWWLFRFAMGYVKKESE